MEEFKPTLCSICFNVISNETFRVIEETTKNVLDALLLTGGIEVNTPLICNVCYTKVFKAYQFKSICINTENCIFPYVDSKNEAPVDLKEIYLKERAEEQLTGVSKDERICRLCMQIVTSRFTSVNNLETDLIRQYIPEMNFNSIAEPVVCAPCLESLKTHGSFSRKCLRMQKSEIVCENEVMDDQFYIKTEEIDIKSEDNCGETVTPFSMEEFKTEPIITPEDDCSPCSHQPNKEPHFLHHQMQHEKVSKILTYQCDVCKFRTKCKEKLTIHRATHKGISKVQMFKCAKCNFQTKHKRYLPAHQLIHKDISELQMYKCDTCTYETKFKGDLARHRLIHKDPSEIQMFKCHTCNFETKYGADLRRHQLKHKNISEIQMYKCKLCSYETKFNGCLLKHQLKHKDVHEVQTYKCYICHFESRYKRSIAKHHQLVHQKILKLYKCDACRFETKCKKYLAIHQLKHNDVVYKCDKCNFETKCKGSLPRHRLVHKDSSEIQMYKCHTCGYEAKRKEQLGRHLLKHRKVLNVQLSSD